MSDPKQARELIEAAERGRLHPLRCCEAGSGRKSLTEGIQ